MNRHSKRGIVPIFIPHKGCPHACVFCNQHQITGSASALPDQIETLVEGIKDNFDIVEVAFYGGSFTALPLDEQSAYLEVAKALKVEGKINRIRLSTRPDALNDSILAFLKDYWVDCIEIGVQSTSECVLEASNRGCTTKEAKEACERVKAYGFQLGVQLMVGLPGDTSTLDEETAKTVIAWRPNFVRIYPTVILPQTDLEVQFRSGAYKALTLDDAISRCALMARLFYEAQIPVIRIGLQEAGDEMVAGPFHPAFRDFVDTRVIVDWITEQFLENSIRPLDSTQVLRLICPKRWISVLMGQKKVGLERLKLLTTKVVVEASETLNDEIQMVIEGKDDGDEKPSILWKGLIPVPLKNEC